MEAKDPTRKPAYTKKVWAALLTSDGAKVIPEKQNAEKIPRIDPPRLIQYSVLPFSKKSGKAKNDGIKKRPTMKKARLKNTNAAKLDSPECDTVRPISLKKFKKKAYPGVVGSLYVPPV